MDDLISRQAAIDRIEEHIRVGDELYPLTEADRILNHAFEIAASCVYNLPSAERKKGKWVRVEDENGDFLCWECSECGERYVMPYHRASYCPNCGAEMRGEEE